MFDHEDQLVVYMTQAVDNLYTKTVNYRPDIDNFNDLVVNVDAEPLATQALRTALSASHQIQFDALRDEEIKVSPKRRAEESDIFLPASGRGGSVHGGEDDDISEENKKPLTTASSLFLKDEHWLCTNCGQR